MVNIFGLKNYLFLQSTLRRRSTNDEKNFMHFNVLCEPMLFAASYFFKRCIAMFAGHVNRDKLALMESFSNLEH